MMEKRFVKPLFLLLFIVFHDILILSIKIASQRKSLAVEIGW